MVNVSVANAPSLTTTLVNGFRYEGSTLEPLEVRKVSPGIGATTGGTVLTIEGSGFTSDTTVIIGTTVAPKVTFISSTTLTAITPPGQPGLVNVTIARPDLSQAGHQRVPLPPAPGDARPGPARHRRVAGHRPHDRQRPRPHRRQPVHRPGHRLLRRQPRADRQRRRRHAPHRAHAGHHRERPGRGRGHQRRRLGRRPARRLQLLRRVGRAAARGLPGAAEQRLELRQRDGAHPGRPLPVGRARLPVREAGAGAVAAGRRHAVDHHAAQRPGRLPHHRREPGRPHRRPQQRLQLPRAGPGDPHGHAVGRPQGGRHRRRHPGRQLRHRRDRQVRQRRLAAGHRGRPADAGRAPPAEHPRRRRRERHQPRRAAGDRREDAGLHLPEPGHRRVADHRADPAAARPHRRRHAGAHPRHPLRRRRAGHPQRPEHR
ncbi:MAG: IPT/TIG domain-containing protein [Myxococcota bacterium]